MRGTTKILRIFGIDIQLHYSWWFILLFLSWALSTDFFPSFFPGYSTSMYWTMGIIAALLLFVSVLLHELSHSLVAKTQKIKVESITLFFFGGVAGISQEEMKPRSELLMALAGPLFSLVLGGLFYLINISNINGIFSAISFYLYQLNFILALFNLVPGYPLDGGRAFRALLYWHYRDLIKATRIAAAVGKFFAGFLFFFGLVGLWNGVGNGLWSMLLGGFLYFIAGVSYNQVVVKDILDKIPVKDLLSTTVPVVSPEMTFKDFIAQFSKTDEDLFLVKGKKGDSVVEVQFISRIPEKMASKVTLKQLAVPLNRLRGLHKNDTAYTAFQRFSGQEISLLPVLENGNVIGVIRRNTVMNQLHWRLNRNSKKKRKI
ncbi:MAG: site-2 protease family protein [Nanoarchaeota archaeon]|nr:site-2 protease family protein [Nanoarchaeota archaeon]